MSNVTYTFSDDMKVGYGHLKDGTRFLFDADMIDKIKNVKLYRSDTRKEDRKTYIIDHHGRKLHNYFFAIEGATCGIAHINKISVISHYKSIIHPE